MDQLEFLKLQNMYERCEKIAEFEIRNTASKKNILLLQGPMWNSPVGGLGNQLISQLSQNPLGASPLQSSRLTGTRNLCHWRHRQGQLKHQKRHGRLEKRTKRRYNSFMEAGWDQALLVGVIIFTWCIAKYVYWINHSLIINSKVPWVRIYKEDGSYYFRDWGFDCFIS